MTENQIQPSADPRMVLPEWLREEGIKELNDTYTATEKIEEIFKTTNEYLTYGCWTAWIWYYYRLLQINLKCQKANFYEQSGKGKPDWKKCSEEIESAKLWYNKLRLVCDRVYCKTAPINPGDKTITVTAKLVGETKPKANKCEPTTQFYCASSWEDAVRYCAIGYTGQTNKTELDKLQNQVKVSYTDDCNPQITTDNKNLCCLRKEAQTQGKGITAIKPMTETDWNIKPLDTKAKEALVDENWNYGAYKGYGAETEEALPKKFQDREETQKALKDFVEGTQSHEQKYVSGLYGTSCFNFKTVGLSGKRAYFEPNQNFMSALQCGCVSQLYGYVSQYRNLVKEAMQCLEEVDKGGQITAGACKEIFAGYVCDLLTWVTVEVVLGKLFPAVGEKVYNSKSATEPSFTEMIGLSAKDMATSFKEEYGGAMIGQYGYDAAGISHKICMGALFNEWDPGLKAIFATTQKAPPRQSNAIISTAQRELLGSNPITGKAVFEYRMGVWLSAGSDLRNYQIQLICDGGDDGLGDCPAQQQPRRFVTQDGSFPGIETNIKMDETRTPGGTMQVINLDFRYNKIRVCWTSAQGTQFNGCEEKEISDVTTGQFGCQAQPTLLPTGNKIFGCQLEITDQFADFMQKPPQLYSVDVTSESQAVKIPFTIRANYGTRDPALEPYLLVFQTLNTETTTTQGGIMQGTDRILDGTTTSTQYKFALTTGSKDFGTQDEVSTLNAVATSSEPADPSKCRLLSKSGTVLDTGELYIDWSGSGDPILIGASSREVIRSPTTTQDTTKYTIKLYGVTFNIEMDKEAKCKLFTQKQLAKAEKVTKQYKIGIYDSRQGEPDQPGSVVFDADGNQQDYTITVTLVNKIGTSTTSGTTISVPTRTGDQITFMITPASGKTVTSYITSFHTTAGKDVQTKLTTANQNAPTTYLFTIPAQMQDPQNQARMINLADGNYELTITATDTQPSTTTTSYPVKIGT